MGYIREREREIERDFLEREREREKERERENCCIVTVCLRSLDPYLLCFKNTPLSL